MGTGRTLRRPTSSDEQGTDRPLVVSQCENRTAAHRARGSYGSGQSVLTETQGETDTASVLFLTLLPKNCVQLPLSG